MAQPIELTPEQSEVMTAIRDWYHEGGFVPLTLGGYAGTGKTTLLGQLAYHFPGKRVIFTSFTGKAVNVLRQKLPPGSMVSTLHRLLYHPNRRIVCEKSGEPIPLQLLASRRGRKPEPIPGAFCEKHDPDDPEKRLEKAPCPPQVILDWTPQLNPLDDYDLVVVDEASMVSERLWRDLTRWGVPVLAVGDHGQLPPVKSDFNLMADPKLRLEKILRQAEGSPIIRMATLARTTGRIPLGDYGPGCVKLPLIRQRAALEHLHPERGDLALCSFHRTRTRLNNTLRKRVLGRTDLSAAEPVEGDFVICNRNNYEAGVFNGSRGIIRDLGPENEFFPTRVAWIELMDEDFDYSGEISTEPFGQEKVHVEYQRRVGIWDYGYAITVHRSQGSQADRVLVFEERFPREDDEFHARLLYTAATRAARSLCILGVA